MRSFAGLLLFFSIPIAIFAAMFWHHGSVQSASCGNKVMHPGDVCHSMRGDWSTDSTYEEMMAAKSSSAPVARAITIGAVIASLAGAAMLLIVPRPNNKTTTPQPGLSQS